MPPPSCQAEGKAGEGDSYNESISSHMAGFSGRAVPSVITGPSLRSKVC